MRIGSVVYCRYSASMRQKPMQLTCHFFFFQAEDGIRDTSVTGVQTCALPISRGASQQLGATEYGCERVVEVVRDAGGELSQSAKLVGLRGALALLPKLRHVARYREHARGAPLDDERRRIRYDVAHLTVAGCETEFQGLRLARERAKEALFGDLAVGLVDKLAEGHADKRLLRRAVHGRGRAA